jgi:Alpha/beta hydrolase domain
MLSLPGAGKLTPTEDVAPGYRELELLIAGEAYIYSGPASQTATRTEEHFPYVTRIIGRFPTDPDAFSGRVFVEPFNTTRGGVDHDRAWRQLAPLCVAQGDGWVGVTVRPSAVEALKVSDPKRYADLEIITNDVEWDILRHLGANLKVTGLGPGSDMLAERRITRLYMVGYSQSGVDTATFSMAFHKLTVLLDDSPVYDGYLPSAHSGSLAAVRTGAASLLPSFEYTPMTAVPVPVVDVETQTDVEGVKVIIDGRVAFRATGGGYVRRPDSDTPGDLYRLYEIAGAPHVREDPECPTSSSFPTDHFIRAAALHLLRWAENGLVPPEAPRIELAVRDVICESKIDRSGNALGGVRSPFVDVPLSTYKAHSYSQSAGLYMLTGEETVFSRQEALDRHGSVDAYLDNFRVALDGTIKAGYLLEADREELLAAQLDKARGVLG